MMDASHFFGLLSAIYIAPHMSEKSGQVLAAIFMTMQVIAWITVK